MLITHWLNLLRDRRGQSSLQHIMRQQGQGHRRGSSAFFDDQLPPWFSVRHQPATVAASAQQERRLRARQRLH